MADGFVLAASSPPLRAASTLILVCVLPGVGLLGLLQGAPPRTWERALWAVTLSLAVIPLVGFALAITPSGVTRVAWVAGINCVALPGLVKMAVRREGIPLSLLPRIHERRVLGRVPGILLAVAVTAAAFVVRTHGADTAARSQSFAELWCVPRTAAFAVGVRSDSPQRTSYRLTVALHPGSMRVFRFTLDSGGEWRSRLRLDRSQWQTGTVVTANLFREGQPQSIRRVRIRVQKPVH
ncbi:MAG TPA: hypothetical protein VE777_21285 [Gaiellales bacterium]|nr:hypothetical protein [Gaiellales bacterium]